MKKNILQILLLFAATMVYGQADRYGPEQKIILEQKFPPAVRPGSDFIMEIKINKGNVGGLAKFQQFLPPGMTATSINNAGADFSFEQQNVKLIWTSIPQDAHLTVRYKINVSTTLTDKKYLSGTFSYVENDRTKKTLLVPKEINISPTAPVIDLEEATAAAESNPVNETTQPEKTETVAAAQPDDTDSDEMDEPSARHSPDVTTPVETSTEEPETKTENEPVTPTETVAPAPATDNTYNKKESADESDVSEEASANSGIVFKVQISAINEKLSRRKNYYQEKFGLQMEVAVEVHEGLKKYTVGNFTSYSKARKFRDEILSNVNDSFVVAYKDGVRIPVPEALELLKKK